MRNYQHRLRGHARRLRAAMTDAEQCLWSRLRRKQIHGVQFYRQKPIGSYIVDFYAPAADLVVEVDGARHLEPRKAEEDEVRTAFLKSQGLRVLRFDDREVLLATDAVIEAIAAEVEKRERSF